MGYPLIQVTKEATARGTVPEDRADRTFEWLKEETIQSLGKKRTLYSRLQAVVSRRLKRSERVKEYWADIERCVDELWAAFTELIKRVELAAKHKLCCNIYTMGLPREFKLMTLNSLPRTEDQTMGKLELVTTNLREGKPSKVGEMRPAPTKDSRNGTSRRFQKSTRRSTPLKCWGCGGEHRLSDCPNRK